VTKKHEICISLIEILRVLIRLIIYETQAVEFLNFILFLYRRINRNQSKSCKLTPVLTFRK